MGKFYEGLYEDLRLYIQQIAWLHAVPDKSDNQKLKKGKEKDERVSRLERLKRAVGDDEYMPDLPPIPKESEYLISYLFEIGPLVYGPMGASIISHSEIRSWQFNMGIDLHPWEVRIIRKLSIDYLNEGTVAEEPNRQSPWANFHKTYSAIIMRSYLRELSKL